MRTGPSGRKYGWHPDVPDKRDVHFTPPLRGALAPVPTIDLRSKMPPVYDQGPLGSCTFNMGGAMVHYLMINRRTSIPGTVFTPSRLAGYYDERAMNGTVDYDSGAQIRDALKVIAKKGVGPEDQPAMAGNWPYDVSKFKQRPPDAYYVEAERHQGLIYSRVAQNECIMKGVLAQGLPIGIGFTVYESFESQITAQTGIVGFPQPGEKALGGHAVLIVGYDDVGEVAPPRSWIVRNSWGPTWGDKGYCYFPYGFLLDQDLASDLWVLQSIE